MQSKLKGCFRKKLSTRFVALFFVLTIMLSHLGSLTYGKPINLEVDTPRTAKVLEVIDGEVLRVLYYYSDFKMPDIKIVKLIGVDTKGSQEAFEHTLASCLGKIVYILSDPSASGFPDVDGLDMEYGYVYNKMSRSINEELLLNGYGVLDDAFKNAKQYMDLKDAEAIAISNELGFYEGVDGDTEPMFNINTASFANMQAHLIDTSDEAITAIINYRSSNKFETKTEVKFAHWSFNQTWYAKNKGLFNVVTDLNNANTYEMTSLFAYEQQPLELAQAIWRYTVFNELTDKSELKFIDEIAQYYDAIEPFIDVKPVDAYLNENKKVANINTCTIQNFVEATGLSTYTATALFTQRDANEYFYKNVGETMVSGAVLYSPLSYVYADNLTAFTDINKAQTFELVSLFGLIDGLSDKNKTTLADKIIKNRPYASIDQLKPYVEPYYADIEDYVMVDLLDLPKSLNLNLANSEVLSEYLDFSTSDLTIYTQYTKWQDYINPVNIKFNLKEKGHLISLFTNINTASYFELMNLNINMTAAIVDEIIAFRAKEPITTFDEVKYIFTDNNRSALYLEIKDFIVFQ